VSGDKRYLLARVPAGSGRALDLGGGVGMLRAPITARGYDYVNLDMTPVGGRAVRGDAHRLPFSDAAFQVIVSGDSLEHFPEPRQAIAEARRVVVADGRFVIWVPFLHPFHGDDFYRYTPLGLRHLLEGEGFEIESIEAPLWAASVMAQILIAPLQRAGLGGLEGPLERAGAWLDARLARFQSRDMSFAAAYLVVARPRPGA
jgi:SAM-dependent methyltransferase